MAITLFKMNRGNKANLPATLTDGHAYFCIDTAELFIDYADSEGTLHRKKINAKDAETLTGVSLEEIKGYSSTVKADLQAEIEGIIIPKKITDLEDDIGGIASTPYIDKAISDTIAKIPTKVSKLENDAKYVDEDALQAVADSIPDISNLAEIAYVDDKISKIPKFETVPVEVLPTENISTTTVYLLKTEQSQDNLYDEYIYVNGAWELLGSAKINLDGYAKVADIPTKTSQLENDSSYISEDYVDAYFKRLNSDNVLRFYCIEDVTIVINGVSTVYPANSNVEVKFLGTDIWEIIPTSDKSILALNAFPGALNTYYSWLEGVKQFSNILFDMNPVDMYSKWSQGN